MGALDDLLPEAMQWCGRRPIVFCIRSTSGYSLSGGIVLHRANIAEMGTGSKTQVALCPRI